MGVVGPNGCGKSTLLLALAGIIQPSEGVVEAHGHVSTLLSLQAGFDSELSGRENIALAGALMGIDHKLMEEITPGIISFAAIGAFIDAPMKTYSSGMRARVGFSIATAVDPDILLLDEVLQTGDNKFKEKSRVRISEVLQTAKAVVMVTHDMSWIMAFCTRAILLDKGHIVAEGSPDEIADMHEDDAERRMKQKRKAKQLVKHGKVDLVDIRKARKAGTLVTVAEGQDDLADDELDDEDRAELEEVKTRIQARAAARAATRAAVKASGEPAAGRAATGDEAGCGARGRQRRRRAHGDRSHDLRPDAHPRVTPGGPGGPSRGVPPRRPSDRRDARHGLRGASEAASSHRESRSAIGRGSWDAGRPRGRPRRSSGIVGGRPALGRHGSTSAADRQSLPGQDRAAARRGGPRARGRPRAWDPQCLQVAGQRRGVLPDLAPWLARTRSSGMTCRRCRRPRTCAMSG